MNLNEFLDLYEKSGLSLKADSNLYVIGDCEDCQFFEEESEECQKVNSWNFSNTVQDGCKHWKKKEA